MPSTFPKFSRCFHAVSNAVIVFNVQGRLSKRHLNIMQRNSAFRGFQFPESQSRLGSTASTASSKMSKMIAERKAIAAGSTTHNGSNKSSAVTLSTMDASSDDRIFSEGNNGISNFQNGNSKGNSGSSGSRKKRLVSVERSVFSSMFPSWSDETVHFLTLCLDPEPSGRPSCNSLMRLPYFMQDNFPSR